MKAKIDSEDIYAIEFYYKNFGGEGVFLHRDDMSAAESSFYNYRTPTLKLKFEHKNELYDFMKMLENFKERIEKENEIQTNKRD